MFMHVRLQLLYSHAWTCTFVQVKMECKTTDFVCSNPGCNFVDYHDCCMNRSLDGCAHAWVYSLILTGWLRPCLGSRLLCNLLWMAAPIPHTSYTWDISCTSLCRFSSGSVFSCACSCKEFHPLSQASCFMGHLLRSNLSSSLTVLVTPLPHSGGHIPGPVRSEITLKHLHYIRLSMEFTCP